MPGGDGPWRKTTQQLPKPTRVATWVGSSVVKECQIELPQARGVGAWDSEKFLNRPAW